MIEVSNVFNNPKEQYKNLKDEIHNHFPKDVADEIEAFIEIKTEKKFKQIWQSIRRRYDSLNILEQEIPEIDSIEKRNEFINRYFELINPKYVSSDLKIILNFNELKADYENFIDKISQEDYGQVFIRYKFNEDVFAFLKQGLTSDFGRLVPYLEEHSKQIAEHITLMQHIKNSGKTRSAVKIVASLLGTATPIPFAGTFAGKLAGSLMQGNIESSINQSFEQIDLKWDLYTVQLQEFIKGLELRYKHILLTLYGGTILQVDKRLRTNSIMFEHLNLLDFKYFLCYNESEKSRLSNWVNESLQGINGLLSKNRLNEADIASNRFFHYVKQNPILSRMVINEKHSVLYLANLYKFAALGRKALEIKKSNVKKFLSFITELYKQMPLVIHDNDLHNIKAPTQNELLMLFIHLSLKHEDINGIKVVLDYEWAMLQRFEDAQGYFGEATDDEEMYTVYIFLVLAHFAKDKLSYSNEIEKETHNVFLSPKLLRKMKNEYVLISDNDKFYKYLRNMIYVFSVGSIIGPIFAFMKKYKKATLSTIAILITLFVLYFNKDLIIEKSTSLLKKETTNIVSNERQLEILVQSANFRHAPDLNSKIIGIVKKGTVLTYLNEKQQDDDHRIWYKIKDKNGNIGWISEKVVSWE